MTIVVDIDDEISVTLRDLHLFLLRTWQEEEVEYFMSCLGSVVIYAVLDDNTDTALETMDMFIYDPGHEALESMRIDELDTLMSVCTNIIDAWYIRYTQNPPDWLFELTYAPGYVTTHDVFYVKWLRGYRYAEIT